MATIMQLENVFRIYRMGQEKIAAVDGVSLDVQEGEILCLQGPSGSGKSTLLHMMAGLDRPSRGSIVLGKTHIEKLSEDRLALFRQRHVGFIFQSYYLIPTLTALENVTLPLMFAGISKSKRNKAGKELLAAVGLKDRMRHKPSEMSGGQQQRVSIARAFANNPRIVFADEPTGNLDTHTTYEMMNLMTRLAKERNHTLVIVTHDLEISGYATRLVKIRDGKIEGIEDGPAHRAETQQPIQLVTEPDDFGEESEVSQNASDGSGDVSDDSRAETEGSVSAMPGQIDPEPSKTDGTLKKKKTKKEPISIFGKRKVQSK